MAQQVTDVSRAMRSAPTEMFGALKRAFVSLAQRVNGFSTGVIAVFGAIYAHYQKLERWLEVRDDNGHRETFADDRMHVEPEPVDAPKSIPWFHPENPHLSESRTASKPSS